MSTKVSEFKNYIRGLIQQELKELEEASVTGALDGGEGPPRTPYAFSGGRKKDKDKKKKITQAAGYTKVHESVNESISAFDVDFYKDTSNRQTSHKEIVRGDKFSDVISKTTKVAKSKKMNYVELYYKGAFIGSIDKKNSFKFRKGRNHQKSPLSVNEGQKKRASDILRKFDMAYIKFSQEVRDVMKLMDKSTGSKVDGKIINKAYGKHLIPFDDLMQSWAKGQQENPGLSEDD